MRSRDIEDGVRRLSWPGPSEDLRARVMELDESGEQSLGLRARLNADAIAPVGQVSIETAATLVSPRWRHAGTIAAVTLAIVAASCAGLDVWAGHEIDVEVARLTARFGSLDVSTLKLPPVPDADNRAIVVKLALAETVPLAGTQHHYIDYRASDPVPEDLRAFAQSNQHAIRLADGVRTRSQSNWNIDHLAQTGYPDFQAFRRLSDAILLTAMVDLEAGRPDDAARVVATGLSVSASLRQETSVLFHHLRLGTLVRSQIEAIHEILTRAEPSSAVLADVASWLAENRSPDALLKSTLADVKQVNHVLARMAKGDIDPAVASYIYPVTWPSGPKAYLGVAAVIGRPFVRQARLRALRHWGSVLDLRAGPRPHPPMPEVAMPQRWALVDRLAHKFTEGSTWHERLGEDFISLLAAAETAVALRRFRLDHGTYPDELVALVPAYLDQLPVDPYTAQVPVYSRQGAGFVLRAKSSGQWPLGTVPVEWRVAK